MTKQKRVNNLENFMNKLEKDIEDAKNPLYQKGVNDGEIQGYELASQRFTQELRSLKTIIDAMIDSKS